MTAYDDMGEAALAMIERVMAEKENDLSLRPSVGAAQGRVERFRGPFNEWVLDSGELNR